MAIVEMNVDLDRVVSALERIASALETIAECQVDPAAAVRMRRMAAGADWDTSPRSPEAGLSALGMNTDESLWEAETQDQQLRNLGTNPIQVP